MICIFQMCKLRLLEKAKESAQVLRLIRVNKSQLCDSRIFPLPTSTHLAIWIILVNSISRSSLNTR